MKEREIDLHSIDEPVERFHIAVDLGSYAVRLLIQACFRWIQSVQASDIVLRHDGIHLS